MNYYRITVPRGATFLVKIEDVQNKFAALTIYDINAKPFLTIPASMRPATKLRSFIISEIQRAVSYIKAFNNYKAGKSFIAQGVDYADTALTAPTVPAAPTKKVAGWS